MTRTDYNLPIFEDTDIADLNYYTEELAEALGDALDNNAALVSDKYDSTSTYKVGDYCIYNNILYKCNTAITTAEAWNSSHWTATNITSEIADSGWVDLTLTNNATPRSSYIRYKPQVRKIGNIVYLKGQITIPAVDEQKVFFKIPEGFRHNYEVTLFGVDLPSYIDQYGYFRATGDGVAHTEQKLDCSWLIG